MNHAWSISCHVSFKQIYRRIRGEASVWYPPKFIKLTTSYIFDIYNKYMAYHKEPTLKCFTEYKGKRGINYRQ